MFNILFCLDWDDSDNCIRKERKKNEYEKMAPMKLLSERVVSIGERKIKEEMKRKWGYEGQSVTWIYSSKTGFPLRRIK